MSIFEYLNQIEEINENDALPLVQKDSKNEWRWSNHKTHHQELSLSLYLVNDFFYERRQYTQDFQRTQNNVEANQKGLLHVKEEQNVKYQTKVSVQQEQSGTTRESCKKYLLTLTQSSLEGMPKQSEVKQLQWNTYQASKRGFQ